MQNYNPFHDIPTKMESGLGRSNYLMRNLGNSIVENLCKNLEIDVKKTNGMVLLHLNNIFFFGGNNVITLKFRCIEVTPHDETPQIASKGLV